MRGYAAADASVDERAAFIMKTYAHLVGAVFAFVGIEVGIFLTGLDEVIANITLSVPWLLVLGLFIGVSWLANRWAMNATSPGMAYAGLGLYVVPRRSSSSRCSTSPSTTRAPTCCRRPR